MSTRRLTELNAKKLIEKYAELLTAVIRDHEKIKADTRGHDFEHALMVANYGARIAEDRHTAELAWVAGICHNTDHLVEKGFFRPDIRGRRTSGALIRKRIIRHLTRTTLNDTDKRAVIEAVLEHRKKNDPRDSKLTATLKDADRLSNVGALHCLRSARDLFRLPTIDYVHLFHHHLATYRRPGSVGKDIWYSLEWEKWLRLPKAKKIGAKRFAFLKTFLQDIENQLKESCIRPYPFPRRKK